MSRHEQIKPPNSVQPPAVDPDLRSGSTDDREPAWAPAPTMDFNRPAPAPRKRRHIFRWVFLAVQILFLVWIITGVSSSSTKSCNNLVGQALTTCQSASHAGTAIGVGLIIGLWMAVDVILALTWLIFRKRA